MPRHDVKHYQINYGQLWFQPLSSPQVEGFEDLGNIKSCDITEEVEIIEHNESRTKAGNRDQIVEKTIKASGTFVLDSLSFENLKKWFLAGDITDADQEAADDSAITVEDVVEDRWNDIGKVKLSNVVVKDSTDTTTYTEGVDYDLNLDHGFIFIIKGGTIVNGSDLHITADVAAATVRSMNAGEVKSNQGHVLFVGDPLRGERLQIKGYVQLLPDGNFGAIKAEYNEVSFKINFIEHSNYSPGLFSVKTIENVTV